MEFVFDLFNKAEETLLAEFIYFTYLSAGQEHPNVYSEHL